MEETSHTQSTSGQDLQALPDGVHSLPRDVTEVIKCLAASSRGSLQKEVNCSIDKETCCYCHGLWLMEHAKCSTLAGVMQTGGRRVRVQDGVCGADGLSGISSEEDEAQHSEMVPREADSSLGQKQAQFAI